ncbi:MBL fold metallo-hydrolase [Sorangium sp. So ce367]|uniref:MBL fold metallo-hydrolase RNA specificity domain-containing protein n=1 Tax=Sorangium sp. So ce367 TaxID=3133305 RepID=UPI003F5F3280
MAVFHPFGETASRPAGSAAPQICDAAAIQVSDARYLNRRAEKQGSDEPRYEDDDAVEAISRLVAAPYHHPIEIAPGVRLTFLDAGHVLGSAVSLLDVVEGDTHRRVAYTGDLGRYERPILRDPEVAERADVLVCESTYGHRLHEGTDELDEDLARVVPRTSERGGKLYIPTFALERAQEVIFALKKLRRHGRIPPLPVYVDSPLTVKLTDVFRLHPECFDVETRALLRGSGSPFDFEDLRYVEDVAGSKAIDAEPEPSIVIAASGMCEAGRILYHLKAGIEDPKNTILIVGYQAQHTLGRRLVEGRSRVRIFGVERDRRAEVVVLNGFSAHADQGDLLRYADRCRERGPLGKIALIHGEPRAQEVLAKMLRARGHGEVVIPAPGDLLEID